MDAGGHRYGKTLTRIAQMITNLIRFNLCNSRLLIPCFIGSPECQARPVPETLDKHHPVHWLQRKSTSVHRESLQTAPTGSSVDREIAVDRLVALAHSN